MVRSKIGVSRKGKEPESESEWFLSEDHRKSWFGGYDKRPLAPERQIDFQSFRREVPIFDKFADLGWQYALDPDTQTSTRMVRLFYCNAHFNSSNWVISSKVYGRRIDIDLEAVSLITNYPNEGLFREITTVSSLREAVSLDVLTSELCGSSFPWRANLPTNKLTKFYRVIFQISTHNLVPKLGHKDEVSPVCAYILFCLGTGVRINLCKFILFYMSQFIPAGYSSLPFGGLITAILENFDFVIRKDEELLKIPKPLGLYSLKKMNILTEEIGPSQPPKKKPRTEEGTSSGTVSNEDLMRELLSLKDIAMQAKKTADKVCRRVDRIVFGLSAYGLEIPPGSEEEEEAHPSPAHDDSSS
eukprot:TRINITY_DN6538_c0_g2_i1.p1 TRINITY_DN6538_c0_g2~~TRINITY_DN6538_c0_g2_i1.p1  ORF type:complete len:358 (-),score=64.44 TRINITY_DN6538_c0_g2_i1:394-1467(-)